VTRTADLALSGEPLVIEQVALSILIARGMLEGDVVEVSVSEAIKAISAE
jgi:hypothetical protein